MGDSNKAFATIQQIDKLESQISKVREFFVEFTNRVISIDKEKLKFDFNLSQLKALSAFKEDKDYTMGELSRNIQVAMPSMTEMIDGLEEVGIVERWRDPDDRRVVRVKLTEKGKKMRKEFMERRREELENIFSKLSSEDWDELIKNLEKASQILKKIG
ncbi:MAG: hypothetical protein A3C43_05170 [Candidatus Schekmanbacteria bacterium RIFCSPHIGHO2_02_FULL_38_11]|uniref:HTH marR-type domain-containing protein n=1 Tax=Candidatus Schekmanbacteria bacterium RIFCSPLOWO2_12_FULL_38_15 TaxID=1817883 RepID=A0A1F7SCD3_9BACT|nr:MAG: hypothetical protein A2043_03365 [Candidatus Schekmanbacteria bacterium GWA2_38_9]OGL51440.1 MAG: hypothetical protein A3G31_06195 [Candidatus Schekmanbacteria bacterium RIFCSPLOWO2_12_FULL_38_15]OGL51553.1 MAG: hypothetical protein A3H37_09370 [Candidatus Schekmanbacteria bacterium RIFCSPLOWO2_02_FULL_38_14]OGL53178.1 MAG: hypothetical protein A3C43_05170 [Candidatus Schekmanbacteria bacterium RIFCSPHIGHO2_02_FULL_38_11]